MLAIYSMYLLIFRSSLCLLMLTNINYTFVFPIEIAYKECNISNQFKK